MGEVSAKKSRGVFGFLCRFFVRISHGGDYSRNFVITIKYTQILLFLSLACMAPVVWLSSMSLILQLQSKNGISRLRPLHWMPFRWKTCANEKNVHNSFVIASSIVWTACLCCLLASCRFFYFTEANTLFCQMAVFMQWWWQVFGNFFPPTTAWKEALSISLFLVVWFYFWSNKSKMCLNQVIFFAA